MEPDATFTARREASFIRRGLLLPFGVRFCLDDANGFAVYQRIRWICNHSGRFIYTREYFDGSPEVPSQANRDQSSPVLAFHNRQSDTLTPEQQRRAWNRERRLCAFHLKVDLCIGVGHKKPGW